MPTVVGPLLHRLRPRTDLYIIAGAGGGGMRGRGGCQGGPSSPRPPLAPEHNPAHHSARAFCDAVEDCVLKQRGLARRLAPHPLSADIQRGGDADRLLLLLLLRAAGPAAGEGGDDGPSGPDAEGGRGGGWRPLAAVRTTLQLPASAPAPPLTPPRRGGGSSMSLDSEPPLQQQSQSPSSARWRRMHRHDGIVAAAEAPDGPARGRCRGCGEGVCMDGARWRCGCGSWAFASYADARRARAHFAAFVDFVTALYVDGDFDARRSHPWSLPGMRRAAGDNTEPWPSPTPRGSLASGGGPSAAEYALPPSLSPFVRGDVFVVAPAP